MLFLLEGKIEMTYADRHYEISEPGTCIYIDATIPHRADCSGDAEARLLVVVSQNAEGDNVPAARAKQTDE